MTKAAAGQMEKWKATGHQDPLIAVNVSTRPRQEADFQRASSAGLTRIFHEQQVGSLVPERVFKGI